MLNEELISITFLLRLPEEIGFAISIGFLISLGVIGVILLIGYIVGKTLSKSFVARVILGSLFIAISIILLQFRYLGTSSVFIGILLLVVGCIGITRVLIDKIIASRKMDQEEKS
ncbi:MAG: hypothetical protein ACFFAO_14835 [Candidatus Hermodarchaeota archaeon]